MITTKFDHNSNCPPGISLGDLHNQHRMPAGNFIFKYHRALDACD